MGEQDGRSQLKQCKRNGGLRMEKKRVMCHLIRHGEIASNVMKIYAGTSQESLTSNGEEQSRLLAEQLEDRGIRLFYASPLRRAQETAKILAKPTATSIVVEEDLREMDLGPWEGLSESQIAREFPEKWQMWNQAPATLRLTGREPLEEVQGRIVALIRNWCKWHTGETIAAVTHVPLIRCALLYSMGKPLNDYRGIPVPNATAYVFEASTRQSDGKLVLKHLHPCGADHEYSG